MPTQLATVNAPVYSITHNEGFVFFLVLSISTGTILLALTGSSTGVANLLFFDGVSVSSYKI